MWTRGRSMWRQATQPRTSVQMLSELPRWPCSSSHRLACRMLGSGSDGLAQWQVCNISAGGLLPSFVVEGPLTPNPRCSWHAAMYLKVVFESIAQTGCYAEVVVPFICQVHFPIVMPSECFMPLDPRHPMKTVSSQHDVACDCAAFTCLCLTFGISFLLGRRHASHHFEAACRSAATGQHTG